MVFGPRPHENGVQGSHSHVARRAANSSLLASRIAKKADVNLRGHCPLDAIMLLSRT